MYGNTPDIAKAIMARAHSGGGGLNFISRQTIAELERANRLGVPSVRLDRALEEFARASGTKPVELRQSLTHLLLR